MTQTNTQTSQSSPQNTRLGGSMLLRAWTKSSRAFSQSKELLAKRCLTGLRTSSFEAAYSLTPAVHLRKPSSLVGAVYVSYLR